MQQAYNLNDETWWEKVRFICYYLANTMFWAKPVKDIQSIMKLKSIDEEDSDVTEKLRQKILSKQKEMALLMK